MILKNYGIFSIYNAVNALINNLYSTIYKLINIRNFRQNMKGNINKKGRENPLPACIFND